MSTITLNLRGTKEELLPKLNEAYDTAKKERSKILMDIIEAVSSHVLSVEDKGVITFSIRGQLVVQHLKRNHEKY